MQVIQAEKREGDLDLKQRFAPLDLTREEKPTFHCSSECLSEQHASPMKVMWLGKGRNLWVQSFYFRVPNVHSNGSEQGGSRVWSVSYRRGK